MGLTADELEELLALASLGALDPTDHDTADGVDLGDEPEARRRRATFERTVAALDQVEAIAPPLSLRSRLLERAARRTRDQVSPSAIPALFAHQVTALAELVASLDEHEWRHTVEPYAWTVHGLMAHLLVIETYTAVQLGLTSEGPAEDSHLAMGAVQRAAEVRGAPEDTALRWRLRATATAAALEHRTVLPSKVSLHGWPFSLDGAMIARSFELWTHAGDIRRATGRPKVSSDAADAADLATMSRFSVEALPLTWALVEPARALRPTRVVLTGAGGGTFDLVDAPGGFETLIVADVTDYCSVAARRIHPDDLDCHIEGDVDAVRSLLRSASVFAV